MPNLALIGAVSKPDLVVAPTRVNGFKFSSTDLAFGPDSIIISIL